MPRAAMFTQTNNRTY